MRDWFSDGVFRTILRNAGYLASGKLVGAVAGIVALSCVGRGLGPSLFGTLALVHAYALAAAALVKFQSWQTVIRYGAPARERGDAATVQAAINLAFGLDIASGLVGMVAAMAVLPLVAPRFGIGPEWLPLAIGYCTLIPTMSSATPIGVLRLLGRFDVTAWQGQITPLLRAIGAATCYALGARFPAYVAVWYVADIAGDLTGWAMALRVLGAHAMLKHVRPGLFAPARALPDAWSFTWTTNLAVSLTAAWSSIGNLVVGAIVGPTAAGLYRIALTLLDSAGKPADLLTKGFYPEIMRLDPASRQPWRIGLRAGLLAGTLGLAMMLAIWLGGKPLVGAMFGRRYLDAYDLLTLMMLALAVSMASFPLQSLLYMVGRQRIALAAQTLATGIYLALLAGLTMRFGLTGAGIAYVGGTLLLALLMLAAVLDSYRQRDRLPGHAGAGSGNRTRVTSLEG